MSFVFSWPASAGALVLQQSPTLLPLAWVTVTTPVLLVNGSNRVIVSTTNTQQFFRLYLP